MHCNIMQIACIVDPYLKYIIIASRAYDIFLVELLCINKTAPLF
jgi:hypothetical protein